MITSPSSHICLHYLQSLLTISRTLNTLYSPLLLKCITLENTFNTPTAWFEQQELNVHQSISENWSKRTIYGNACCLPNLFITNANTILMPTQQLHLRAKNAGVGVSQ
jgi:hypothetical protein